MKSKYAMTEAQVESLAREIVASSDLTSGARTTYLRVLVTHMQSTLGNVKRGKSLGVQAQVDALQKTNDKFYGAVLRGITTPELEAVEGLEQAEATRRSLERNRRSTFARTQKSTLLHWIKTGGDMRALDCDTVTRDSLSGETRTRRGINSTAYTIERRRAGLIRLIEGEAKDDPHGAREDIERTMEELQRVLDSLSPNGNTEANPTITQVLKGRPAHTRQPAPAGRAHA